MKQAAWIALLFVVTLGVALWALGVFRKPDETPITPPPAVAPPSPAPTDLAAADVEPKSEPTPEIPEFAQPVRVLLLGDTHRSFTAWLEQLWDFVPQGVHWQAWYAQPAPEGVRTHVEQLPALDHAPTAPDLEAVGVLVVAGVDPAALSPEFWQRVADRVKSGSLGVLVCAENRFAAATAAEPSLASILPVKDVKGAVPSSPGSRDLAGVFPSAVPLRATDAGVKHPATRLVPMPGWSRKMWDQQATRGSEGAWETKFCAQVDAVVPGASVLVEADAGAHRWPAVVAHDSPTRRVMWVGGFFDVGDPAYRGSKSIERFRAMCISWVAFLAGTRS